MRAAVLHGRGDVRIEDVPRPSVGPDEVLVKIGAVGVCGTDAHEYAQGPEAFPIIEQNPITGHIGPMIPGHELAGVIVEVGAQATGLEEGALVVSGAGISCGTCTWCSRGMTNLCKQYVSVGLQRHGGLAEYCSVPASTVAETGEFGLGVDVAALAQPMAIAVHAMARGGLSAGDVAVVIGVGGIGAFLCFAAAELGAVVVVSDPDPERLSIASSLGATVICDPRDQDLHNLLDENHLVPHVIYEVSGTRSGLVSGMEAANRGTVIVPVGLQSTDYAVDMRNLSLRELTVVGTNAHVAAVDLPEALRLLAARRESWSDVAPVAIPLELVVSDALEPMTKGQSNRIKTLIDPTVTETRSTAMPGAIYTESEK